MVGVTIEPSRMNRRKMMTYNVSWMGLSLYNVMYNCVIELRVLAVSWAALHHSSTFSAFSTRYRAYSSCVPLVSQHDTSQAGEHEYKNQGSLAPTF